MLHANVADGVHRIEDANTNWYLLEHDGRLTVVDLVARAATVDTARNLRTLDALLETSARTVLVGYGDPWTDGIASAVAQARDAGAA